MSMAEETIEKIKNLGVEERIKKLKEIEKKNKEEIRKAQELLRESEEELEDKEKEKASIPIPQLRAVDIGGLFTEEEKQLFKTKRFDEKKPKQKEALEDTVAFEGKKLKPEQIEQIQHQYRIQFEAKPATSLYEEMKNISYEVQKTGLITPEQITKINAMEYQANKRLGDESYNPSEYVASKLVAVHQIGEELKKKYRGR